METKLSPEQPPEEGVQNLAATPAKEARALDAATRAFAAYEAKILAGGGSLEEAASAIVDLTPVTTLLAPRHLEYLRMRAALHGEAPEVHLETILRNFRSYFDDKRPELTAMEAQRNGGAVTRRVA